MPSLLSRVGGWFKSVFDRASSIFKPKPIIPKEPKMMHRLTVAINYVIRKKYYAYRITMWGKTREDLEKNVETLQHQCAYYVSKKVETEEDDWWWKKDKIRASMLRAIGEDDITAMELEEVPYDDKMIGKREAVDEFLLSRERKRNDKVKAEHDRSGFFQQKAPE